MNFKAALIGCGKIGSQFATDPLQQHDVITHAEAYVRCAKTELVCVCDQDGERLQECSQLWSIPAAFNSVSALLAETKPDIVSICTPDATHHSIAKLILDSCSSVKAIICEKPLATDLAQAEGLVQRAQSRGILLAVPYIRRYAPNLCSLNAFLKEGGLGEIQAISGWYTKGTLHNGTHWFDLLRFLVGEVESVFASDSLRETGQDPTLDVSLTLRGGIVASLRACDSKLFSIFEMDIVGTAGRARLSEACFKIDTFKRAPSVHYSGYYELHPDPKEFGEHRDGMLKMVEDVVDSVSRGHAPRCCAENAVEALRIGWAALESASSGRPVILNG